MIIAYWVLSLAPAITDKTSTGRHLLSTCLCLPLDISILLNQPSSPSSHVRVPDASCAFVTPKCTWWHHCALMLVVPSKSEGNLFQRTERICNAPSHWPTPSRAGECRRYSVFHAPGFNGSHAPSCRNRSALQGYWLCQKFCISLA